MMTKSTKQYMYTQKFIFKSLDDFIIQTTLLYVRSRQEMNYGK